MKVVVLGAHGYIGQHLSEAIENDFHEVIRVNRKMLDFDREDAFQQLSNILTSERPRVVINAVGSIDAKALDNPRLLFNSILLPTYLIFKFYSEIGREDEVEIFILGSNSVGEPRRGYPLYAALKLAEVGLSKTAKEIFSMTHITWSEIKVPRLLGGLGIQNPAQDKEHSGADTGLEELTASIRKVISDTAI